MRSESFFSSGEFVFIVIVGLALLLATSLLLALSNVSLRRKNSQLADSLAVLVERNAHERSRLMLNNMLSQESTLKLILENLSKGLATALSQSVNNSVKQSAQSSSPPPPIPLTRPIQSPNVPPPLPRVPYQEEE